MIKESFQIFRRNPLASTGAVFLIIAASMGQVLSLGSLYPILQILTGGDNSIQAIRKTAFGTLLNYVGAEVTLVNLLLVFLVVGAAYSCVNLLAEAFQGVHLRNLEVAVRTELFEAIVSSDWQYGRKLRHGEIVNIITREAQQYKLMVKYAFYTVGSLLQFLALLSYAAYLNWRLTSFGTLLFGIGSLVLIPILRYTNQLGKASPHIANQMSNRLIAALRSLKTAKALSLESFLSRTVQPSFRNMASNYFQQGLLVFGQYAITELVAFVAISSMLYVGLLILRVPQAELFILLVLLFRALPQVRAGIDNYHRALASLPSLQLIRQHLSQARAASTRPGGIRISPEWSVITFRGVSFQFDDSAVIVESLNTQVHRGEFWAILGPSGAGKTTVLDLLLGLLQPRDGEILIDKVRLSEVDLRSWHSQLAYLGQESFVFAGTLRSNLLWGSDIQYKDADLVAALRAVRLDGLAERESELLEREISENGSNLSGGERQRLALARLFLRQPTLIVLDEPTTGLDSETERTIFSAIRWFSRSVTLIVVTHREELARDADHIIRLSPEGVTVESQNTESSARAPV